MSYQVRKYGDIYIVVNIKTGYVVGEFPTQSKANGYAWGLNRV